MTRPPLSTGERVILWDRALAAVRAYFRDSGLREVSTRTRVHAPAVEPYIEPVLAPPMYMATSPELAMKRLLCRGGGSMFQISHVFRRAEQGAQHSEEFHLVEWYRVGSDADSDADLMAAVVRDVEALVAAVFAVADRAAPRWCRGDLLDLMDAMSGLRLRGDEDPDALAAVLGQVGPDSVSELLPGLAAGRIPSGPDAAVGALAAWTELFSSWSDGALPAWLAEREQDGFAGAHVGPFPAALAALSRRGRDARGRAIARRFESHVHGVELANGYLELRDAAEQRRRFEVVNGLRQALDQAPLPLDAAFLADLESPGLPRCAGVALGLDRLLMLAVGARELAAVELL